MRAKDDIKTYQRLLERLIKNNKFKTVAELGVREGKTSRYLIENCPGIDELLLVDAWYEQDNNLARALMLQQEHPERIIIFPMSTEKAVIEVADEYFDLVFINTNQVEQDIANWKPKVRSGGILCGCDYADDGLWVKHDNR